MSGAVAQPVFGQSDWRSSIMHRQLNTYPATAPRVMYLAITVLATVMLYYELYVGGSVTTLLLPNLNMTFTFYVALIAVGNLIGAFGSFAAGLADRAGRANMVVYGLLITGLYTLFVIPLSTTKWLFALSTFVVGIVEGICLVATPALIRDFSPQVGRATAMGFWTAGPVLGSLVVTVVASHTVPSVVSDGFWTHEYKICGVVGLVVFVVAWLGLRELSPGLRDQLMVSMRDRLLVEARARGLSEDDIRVALRHPFRQLLKPDVIISAFAVAVMLLIYYTAVGFSLIYLTSMFGFSVKNANGLGNWNWGFNAIGVVAIGLISDRFRVRKPFMVIGAIGGAVMVVVYLMQAGHHPSYYTLAIILAVLAFCLGVAYTPWMASFTETVEARNPALTATGLAIWGFIVRVVVFASALLLLVVVRSVTPLVDYGTQVQTYVAQYSTQLAFGQSHPAAVATAEKYSAQIAYAKQFAPELAVIQANPALFTKLSSYPSASSIPPALLNQAITAAGGGAKGIAILGTISANEKAIDSVIAAAPQLATIQPYSAQLTALSKVPPSVIAYLNAHASAVETASTQSASQWKNWYWICFGGIIFFLLSIPLLRGRWSPSAARRDEEEHERLVQEELTKLGLAGSES
jgi:MFS transporter, ACS family, D-galactonate transporter